MRYFVPLLIAILACGCSRTTHVRDKVYSVLPQLEDDMRSGAHEQSFSPSALNPWVEALGTREVVDCLEIAVDELPQYRRATLWMLKAYAADSTWKRAAAKYPEIANQLPPVAGYGIHPKTTEPIAPANPD